MLEYVKKISKKTPKVKFSKVCPHVSEDLASILDNLLLLNPYFRCSASESLKWKMFNQIRDKSMETSAPFKLNLDVDRDDAFDYE